MISVSRLDELDPAQRQRAAELVEAATVADGVAPVSESVRLAVRSGAGTHLLARAGERVIGYANLDGDTAELVVDPDARRHGAGNALVTEVIAGVPGTKFWSHGRHPGAVALARRHGLRVVRELLRMRRDLTALPDSRMPDGVTLRAFVPGRDEDAVVAVNARAFAWHPEQGRMSVADLRAREGEPWFDAAGFLLAERDGTLLGFHWTKVHSGELGEVYVVGVDPDAQGGGLGKALTMAGLRHLADAGRERVMLYVEADNEPAVALYTRLGFQPWDSDVQYAR